MTVLMVRWHGDMLAVLILLLYSDGIKIVHDVHVEHSRFNVKQRNVKNLI